MVKRLLTLVVLMLAIAGMQAQTLQVAPNRALKHSIQHAPRKASNLDGTIAWGLGGDSQWGALGLGSGAVGIKFSVAIHVPGDGVLKGSKKVWMVPTLRAKLLMVVLSAKNIGQ